MRQSSLRSTWDYHERPAAFDVWLRRVASTGIPLWNPLPLVSWNMRKTYLRDLEAAGLAVVPTVWALPGILRGAVQPRRPQAARRR